MKIFISIAFTKEKNIETSRHNYTEAYKKRLAEFYLKM